MLQNCFLFPFQATNPDPTKPDSKDATKPNPNNPKKKPDKKKEKTDKPVSDGLPKPDKVGSDPDDVKETPC